MKQRSYQPKRRIKKQQPAQKNHQNDPQFFEAQVQRKCEKCEDKEEDKKDVQKKSNEQTSGGSKNYFGHYMNNINGKGSMMSNQNRTFFENRMNDNFGNVKLHNDKEAANAAKEIGAKAFTWKNHIVLNGEYFEEGSLEGKQLLAHELKHVQQQKNGAHKIQMMPEDESTEPTKEEGVQTANASEGVAMEKEAEQEENMILTPVSLPNFQTFGIPSTMLVNGKSVSFKGETEANFDNGVGTTQNLKGAPAKECVGCEDDQCFHVTGQLVINYGVTTSVSLPDVPEGLTPCQHKRVRNAIDNILAPHEQEHVKAFSQYNGSVKLPINYTGCKDGLEAYVQQLHDVDAAAREKKARGDSAALDPFHISVDLNCVDKEATAEIPDIEE